jgi:hypothetical protein
MKRYSGNQEARNLNTSENKGSYNESSMYGYNDSDDDDSYISEITVDNGENSVVEADFSDEPKDTNHFLFVYHIYKDKNDVVQLQIVDVFETDAPKFILGSTYYDLEPIKDNINIKNHIKPENTTFLSSKFITTNNASYTTTSQFKRIENFEIIKQPEKDGFIVFCTYDMDGKYQESFYTKGTIFYYKRGIGSSQKIENFSDTNDDIDKTILNQRIFYKPLIQGGADPRPATGPGTGRRDFVGKPLGKPTTYAERVPGSTFGPVSTTEIRTPNPVARNAKLDTGNYKPKESQPQNAPKYVKPPFVKPQVKPPVNAPVKPPVNAPVKPPVKAPRNVINPDGKKTPGKSLENSMQVDIFDADQVYNELYINSIQPEKLFEIINQSNADAKLIISDIIKYLYIDISIQPDNFEQYNFLYKCVHEFYLNLNQHNKIYNNELKKEMKTYNGFKINKLIDKYNQAEKNIQGSSPYDQSKFYCYESFVIHKADYKKFKSFVFKKFDILTKKFNYNTEYVPFAEFLNRIDHSVDSGLYKLDNNTIALIPELKKYIESINSGINTYLKITNFEETNTSQNYKTPFNVRYQIEIKDDNMIEMKYASENKPFYIESVQNIGPSIISQNSKVDFKNINYDSNFVFGPFNYVFDQKLTPENIINDKSIEPLITQIKDGKPVFLLGYGASGSGKTSSLIYFSKQSKPGILIYLCNVLAKKYDYKNIELKCMEFFEPSYDNDIVDAKYKKIEGTNAVFTDSETFKFAFNDKSFVLTENVKYTINHPYKQKNQKEKLFNTNGTDANLEQIIYYLIETDRLIKATPNNPNSSRSHVLCFLKLKTSKNKEANIIIGDLAGVENEFKCNTVNDIKKLFNKKRDNTNQKFYQTEFSKVGNSEILIDPFKGGGKAHGEKADSEKADGEFVGGGEKLVMTSNENNLKIMFQNPYFIFDQNGIINMFRGRIEKYLIKNKEYNLENSIFKLVETILLDIGVLGENEIGKDVINENKSKTNITKMNDSLFEGLQRLNKQILTNDESLKEKIRGYQKLKYNRIDKSNPPSLAFSLLYQAINGWNLGGERTFRKRQQFNWDQGTKSRLGDLLKSDLIDIFIAKIKECLLANKIMKNVCEHRVIEGKFINSSLQQLTDDFLNIIHFKNKDVYYVPRFDKRCLSSYCSNSSYFSIKTDDVIISDPKSIIIKKIIENVKTTNDKFYNDLEIYVFCFFNWSRTANNPPPVPYIDINGLKKMLYLSNDRSFIFDDFDSQLTECIDKAKQIGGIGNNIFLELTKLKQHLINQSDKKVYSDFYEKAHKIFINIDNINAATAIGTIEFLDQLAKLNTIKNSCQI